MENPFESPESVTRIEPEKESVRAPKRGRLRIVFAIALLYPFANSVHIFTQFIPDMGTLLFWSFVAPLIATIGTWVFLKERIRPIGRWAAACLGFTLYFGFWGLSTFEVITAMWASV